MQVLKRAVPADNWVTLIFVFLLLLLFILKVQNATRLRGQVGAFFTKGFIEQQITEKTQSFSFFSIVLFLFSTIVLALSAVFVIKDFEPKAPLSFLFFIKILAGIMLYFLTAACLDFLLVALFKIKKEFAVAFTKTKTIYAHNLTLLLFPICVLTKYSFNNSCLLLIAFGTLFLIYLLLIVANNKNLIVKKLFYFILYLCTLKIVPLLIIYKLLI